MNRGARRQAIVVGGGVVGLSTAYQLARRGYGKVLLLEKGAIGEGSSRRAAGITTGLLWNETGVRARKIALELFRELGRTLPDYTYHDEQGCLNLFSPALWPGRAALLPIYDRLDVSYRVLSAAEIHGRWPALHPAPEYLGLHDPHGGYSEPSEYLPALAAEAARLGVELCEQMPVDGWIVQGGRLCGVRAGDKSFFADAVVATVHVWTLPLLTELGIRPPVKHFVHQRYLCRPAGEAPAFPPVNADPFSGYVRPAAGGRILIGAETAEREEWKVSGRDFSMNGLRAPPGLFEEILSAFTPFLPALARAQWEAEEAGLISFSMDGDPVLGPVSRLPGLFLGQAFHSGGFSYNPVAGLLLAEWVSEGKTSIDVSSFSPDRFHLAEGDAYLASTVSQKHAVRRRH